MDFQFIHFIHIFWQCAYLLRLAGRRRSRHRHLLPAAAGVKTLPFPIPIPLPLLLPPLPESALPVPLAAPLASASARAVLSRVRRRAACCPSDVRVWCRAGGDVAASAKCRSGRRGSLQGERKFIGDSVLINCGRAESTNIWPNI